MRPSFCPPGVQVLAGETDETIRDWMSHMEVDSPLSWGDGIGDEKVKEVFIREDCFHPGISNAWSSVWCVESLMNEARLEINEMICLKYTFVSS